MIKLMPYFHIGSYELAKELFNAGNFANKTVNDLHQVVCDFFNVEYSFDYTQLVYTGYDDIIEMRAGTKNKNLARLIVDIIQRDNMNVLAYTDTFCIEF